MLKITSIVLLFAMSFQGSFASSIPFSENVLDIQFVQSDFKISSTWGEHAKDFVELIDVDKLVAVVFGYLNDPEVMNFVTFAFKFLGDKGYDVDSAINFINSALELPPFEKPKLAISKSTDEISRGTGLTGLIEDVIANLPMEEIKKLFESKLETSPEVAELFETLNSPEFLEIMKNMSKNPKFIEIKQTFAGYGFDFKYVCAMAKEIFGEYYQGVFCEM
ncbi:Uncharacterized protein OBRU01_11172 [Operophtera brumata]|uniref:Protein G12 n=1 Tax=Operophtera brumata TaxID=104452 RepID=A0A0L7LCH4_OPEBR|nr:Uncharacterized protein OBRU01_11172 [Operophtera brumata]